MWCFKSLQCICYYNLIIELFEFGKLRKCVKYRDSIIVVRVLDFKCGDCFYYEVGVVLWQILDFFGGIVDFLVVNFFVFCQLFFSLYGLVDIFV